MEFPFDVNLVLPFEITILNGDYRVLNPGQPTKILAPEKLTCIIDTIGEASYKAQELHGAVTTARKFRTSDHRLYIIKKADDNKNLGSVVGILKVGSKHLYIYDSASQVHERTPLCVLDFFVHESKQRLGYGKKLFDTMLNFEKCAPYELAIDRPSNKCLAFLHKHYNLSSPIHQVNNFVVYQGFFNQSLAVTTNQKSSAGRQQQGFTSWLLSSQRQQHRPFSEQIDGERNQRMKIFADENDLFRRPQVSSGRNDRQPVSYYRTSYNRHYNQNTLTQKRTDKTQYIPRVYSEVSSQTNSNSHLSSGNTTNQLSTTNDSHLPTSKSNSSLIKATNNQQQQQSSSSTWRIFGIPQLYN